MKKALPIVDRRTKFAIPLTGYVVYLFIASNPCEVFAKTAPKLFQVEPHGFHACAVRGPAGYGLYLPARNTDHDDIAHEVLHVVTYLLDTMGHAAGVKDEFGPRIAGFITARIYRSFEKAHLTIR